MELSYSLNGGPFKLVGSTGDITVQPVPAPGSLALLAMGSRDSQRGVGAGNPGSALVPSVGFGVPPKRTSLPRRCE